MKTHAAEGSEPAACCARQGMTPSPPRASFPQPGAGYPLAVSSPVTRPEAGNTVSGYFFGGAGSPSSLAVAVLNEARLNALGVVAGLENRPKRREIEDARKFWQDTKGAWAESRATWCDIAGLCPDATREAVLAQIALAPPLPDEQPVRASLDRHQSAARNKAIIGAYNRGATPHALAKKHNVTPSRVWQIIRREQAKL